MLVGILLLPGLLAFAATGLVATDDYSLIDARQPVVLHCVGAPLVHTVHSSGLGDDSQFFPGALLVNALVWIAVTAGIWWCLHLGIRALLAYRQSGKRKFTIGQMLAVSVGIAMALSAWRWDLAADAAPWQSTLKEAQTAFAQHQPAGPAVQPLMRFSVLAAGYAYLGVGCAGLCLVSGGLWIVRQFLPRRPGEDKSLLQQIF